MSRISVNPFQEISVPCPLCEAEQEHYRLKQTLYTEKNRDIDLRPKSVDWNPKASPKVDPKVYYFWECENCHFSADYKNFQKPFDSGVISAVRFRKLLRGALEQDPRYPKDSQYSHRTGAAKPTIYQSDAAQLLSHLPDGGRP